MAIAEIQRNVVYKIISNKNCKSVYVLYTLFLCLFFTNQLELKGCRELIRDKHLDFSSWVLQ
jgi:hypothetical protein